MSYSGVLFDSQDQELFFVQDPRLRADALRQSILPRLHLILRDAIALIHRVYGVEALNDSVACDFPAFRTDRDEDLDLLYDSAFVGLGGKRAKGMWPGVQKKNGKEVQFLPFRFGFRLTEDGLGVEQHNAWLKGLTDESFQKFLDFDLENEAIITPLCFISGMAPAVLSAPYLPYLASLADRYRFRTLNRRYDNDYYSERCYYPVAFDRLERCVNSFVQFYPVYASYIQIARGQSTGFEQMISKLNQWLREGMPTEDFSLGKPEEDFSDEEMSGYFAEIDEKAAQAAASKVRVMPALRWRVFQRDSWKCVACGRSSHDGVILHVDHVLPRSKGGKDVLDNLQTLCHLCNLGKSNKDTTNLRAQ